jgi:DNA-directed RNA polymerase specialized sigma24 family protein
MSLRKGDPVDRVPLDRLDREWQALTSGALPAQLRAWALEEPVLAAFASPSALIRFLHTRGAGPEKDAVLRGLLARARVDPLAARVVLQALRPGLKGLAKRIFLDADDVEQLWQLLLASVWEQIRTYPLERRPRRIAANLLLDSMRAALTELARERRRRHELPASPIVPDAAAAPTAPDVETLLGRAVAAGAISADEAELILRTRIDDQPLASAAREFGVSYNVLRVRLQRAERRLLLHLGIPPVPRRRRKRPSFGARAVGAQAEAGAHAHGPSRDGGR